MARRRMHGAFDRDDGGVVGVLKAGGAYVPLDPNYPSERLAFMIKDAARSVADAGMAAAFAAEQQGLRIQWRGIDGEEFAGESKENLRR